MDVILKAMSTNVIIIASFCLFIIMAMQDTGEARKFRKIQGVMIWAISPATLHSDPKIKLNRGGANTKSTVKNGSPIKKRFL
jgi:hypothetical protein